MQHIIYAGNQDSGQQNNDHAVGVGGSGAGETDLIKQVIKVDAGYLQQPREQQGWSASHPVAPCAISCCPKRKREKCEQSFPTTELFIWSPPKKDNNANFVGLLQGNMAYAQLSVYKAGKGQQVQSMEIKIQLEGL